MKKSPVSILIIITVVMTLLCSCGAGARNNVSYENMNYIPMADIKIAYLYENTDSLYDDIQRAIRELYITSDKLTAFCVRDFGALELLFENILSEGYNVVITGEGFDVYSLEQYISQNENVYFILNCDGFPYYRNVVSYSKNDLEYLFILGALCANKTLTQKIGVLDANNEKNASFYSAVNAFALGVKFVMPGAQIVLSENVKTLEKEKCDIIYVHGTPQSTVNTRLYLTGIDLYADNAYIDLRSDYSYFITQMIKSFNSGKSLSEKHISVGVNYGLFDGTLKALELNEVELAEVDAIVKYFSKGNRVFSNDNLIINEGEIINITSPVKDNNQNTMIDEEGNYYYYYYGEAGEKILMPSNNYETLISTDMNYYIDNIMVK